jgi:hypothetical protein
VISPHSLRTPVYSVKVPVPVRHPSRYILAEKGYDYSLANLSGLLQAVDYRILNMETPLTQHRVSTLKGKEYLHYSDPVKAPAALSRFGPIAYSLANNHTLDQGAVGPDDTLNSLDTAGARHFGAGKDISEAAKPLLQMFRIGDTSFTIAIFGGLEYNGQYAEQFHFYADANHSGVAPVDVPAVETTIRELRQRTPNLFVVYYMHVLQTYSWKTPYSASARSVPLRRLNRRDTPCFNDLIASASVPRSGSPVSKWTCSGITTYPYKQRSKLPRIRSSTF